MQREMRRKEKAMDQSEAQRLLKEGEYGILSTISADGKPYGVALNYVYAENEGCLYFHCAREGHKLDNLRENPSVSFVVVGAAQVLPQEFSTSYQSVVAFGQAEILEDDHERERVLLLLCEKYSADYMEEAGQYIHRALNKTGVVKIGINRITGKAGR